MRVVLTVCSDTSCSRRSDLSILTYLETPKLCPCSPSMQGFMQGNRNLVHRAMQNLLSSGSVFWLAVLVGIISALAVCAGARPWDPTSNRSAQYTFPVHILIKDVCPYGLWPLDEVASGKITITTRYNTQSNSIVAGNPRVGGVEGVLMGSVSGTKWAAKQVTEVRNKAMLTKQGDGSLIGINVLYIKVIGVVTDSKNNNENFRLPTLPEPPVFIVKLAVRLQSDSKGFLKVDRLSGPEITCT